MKSLLLILSLLYSFTAFGAILVWDPNPATDNVTHYTVYEASGGATNRVSVGTNTSFAINLSPGASATYFVTATSGLLESDPSETVSYLAPPLVTLPLSPTIVKASWARSLSTNGGLLLVSLSWQPVTNSVRYIITRAQTSGVSTSHTVMDTNWTGLIPYGAWRISVQSSNRAGISAVESSVLSPGIVSSPTGVTLK